MVKEKVNKEIRKWCNTWYRILLMGRAKIGSYIDSKPLPVEVPGKTLNVLTITKQYFVFFPAYEDNLY